VSVRFWWYDDRQTLPTDGIFAHLTAHLPLVERCIALSVANEAECLVMHASEAPILAESTTRRAGDARVKRHIDAVMTELRAALQRLAPLSAESQVRVAEGNAHFLICEHMRDFSPDLVALGTHARSR
jgi:nucleotide-binding universal stress UspA family protein